MDNIIKELIQIESKADTIITEVREEMKRMDDEMRKKEKEIRASIDSRTSETVNTLVDGANRESARKIAEIKQNSNSMTVSLEKLFEQNRSKWEADIVNQIIGT